MAQVNNYTEASRTFNTGFFLTEQELRRLIEIIIDQFEKIEEKKTTKIKYIIRSFNGFVLETDDLDYILKLENDGPSQIIELEIIALTSSETNSIKIIFSNTLSDRSKEDKSIRYSIKSENRDWAMISSSLIDDRLNKISTNNLALNLTRRIALFASSLVMIGFLTFLIFKLGNLENKSNDTLKVIGDIERKLNSKENLNVLKSIIDIEKSKLKYNSDLLFVGKTKYFLWIIIPLMLITTFFDPIKKLITKYFPNRIFYWGDYVEKHNKIIKRRNLFLGFVFVTIFISIVVNLFSNFLWEEIAK